MDRKKIIKICALVALVVFIANLFVYYNSKSNAVLANSNVNYTKFISQIENKEIKSVEILQRNMGPRELTVTPNTGTPFKINVPDDENLVTKMLNNDVTISAKAETSSAFLGFITIWGPILLLVGVLIWLAKRSSGGPKGLLQINKSKAQLINPDDLNVTFNDVVGCDEAKLEMQEFIEFFKNPEKFSKIGGKIPRGVLLSGPSGTGKTLMAKALAKQSGVSFLSLSGSEFVEMFVGVGASRVRDLFETARKNAPCVIFIDEIDAIGAARSSNSAGSGGHDEREQTLNQILVELDGFSTDKGVLLVAATNRPEILDKALLRPGRIDRQIVVGLPDVNGREAILKIHTKTVPLDNDVDLSKIARGTPGYSGAELANIINEAAIFAARTNKIFVKQEDLENAKDKIMMGLARSSLAMSIEDKRDTAYHEAGHAIIAKLLPHADPVHKVTIIPRGRALGLTLQLPEQDRFSYKAEYLVDKITILMGGRAAEEIFCNTRTNGASNDISVATSIAKSMVTEWGMSDLGPIAFASRDGNGFLSNGQLSTNGLSETTLKLVESTIHTLLNNEYVHAKTILEENKDIVEAMTQALMEVETIDDWQIENLMQRRHFNDPKGLEELKSKSIPKSPLDYIKPPSGIIQPPPFVPDTI